MAGQNDFLRGPSDAFHSNFHGNEGYERRFNPASWIASTVAQATRQTQAEKKSSSNYGPKITSCWRAENQEHAAYRQICEKFNSRMKSKKILIIK